MAQHFITTKPNLASLVKQCTLVDIRYNDKTSQHVDACAVTLRLQLSCKHSFARLVDRWIDYRESIFCMEQIILDLSLFFQVCVASILFPEKQAACL